MPDTAAMPTRGRLFLVPTPLDFGCPTPTPIDYFLPQASLVVASGLCHWISENAKSTRHFLNRINAVTPLAYPLQQHTIGLLPRSAHKQGDHVPNAKQDLSMQSLLQACLDGHDMGLVSEAGMPTIADPGSAVVRAAHQLGIRVVPLVGPVSLMMALASSGLNGQNFAFVGYLPVAPEERHQRIAQLQAHAKQTGQTQILIETPYRNPAVLDSLKSQLAPSTRLAVLCGAGLAGEVAHSAPVSDWRRQTPVLPLALPTVFMFG